MKSDQEVRKMFSRVQVVKTRDKKDVITYSQESNHDNRLGEWVSNLNFGTCIKPEIQIPDFEATKSQIEHNKKD